MNDLKYDWPCICGHLAEQHDFDQVAQNYTACLVRGNKVQYFEKGASYADDCGQFKPINNLAYLESKI